MRHKELQQNKIDIRRIKHLLYNIGVVRRQVRDYFGLTSEGFNLEMRVRDELKRLGAKRKQLKKENKEQQAVLRPIALTTGIELQRTPEGYRVVNCYKQPDGTMKVRITNFF